MNIRSQEQWRGWGVGGRARTRGDSGMCKWNKIFILLPSPVQCATKKPRDEICPGMYARLEKRGTHLSKLPFV